MTKFTTTLKEIRKHNPCPEGWKTLLRGLGTTDLDTKVTLLEILEINGVKDAFWALEIFKFKDYYMLIVNILKSIKHLMTDKRSIAVIKGIEDYYTGKISKKEFVKIKEAASEVADTFDVADTFGAATYAAYAASYAAYATITATNGAYTANFASYADTSNDNWEQNEIILREFLAKEVE